MAGEQPPTPSIEDTYAFFDLMYPEGYRYRSDNVTMLRCSPGYTDAMARVDQYSIGGGYVGDSNLFEHLMAILRPDCAARLEELRSKYDPDGRSMATRPSCRRRVCRRPLDKGGGGGVPRGAWWRVKSSRPADAGSARSR